MKALGLRPRAFICFSVFGTRDKALALVFDILHKTPHTNKEEVYRNKVTAGDVNYRPFDRSGL